MFSSVKQMFHNPSLACFIEDEVWSSSYVYRFHIGVPEAASRKRELSEHVQGLTKCILFVSELLMAMHQCRMRYHRTT